MTLTVTDDGRAFVGDHELAGCVPRKPAGPLMARYCAKCLVGSDEPTCFVCGGAMERARPDSWPRLTEAAVKTRDEARERRAAGQPITDVVPTERTPT